MPSMLTEDEHAAAALLAESFTIRLISAIFLGLLVATLYWLGREPNDAQDAPGAVGPHSFRQVLPRYDHASHASLTAEDVELREMMLRRQPQLQQYNSIVPQTWNHGVPPGGFRGPPVIHYDEEHWKERRSVEAEVERRLQRILHGEEDIEGGKVHNNEMEVRRMVQEMSPVGFAGGGRRAKEFDETGL